MFFHGLLFLQSFLWNFKSAKFDEVPRENRSESQNTSNIEVKPTAGSLTLQASCTPCKRDGLDGTCMYAERCFVLGGQVGQPCNNQLICCTFVFSCGDATAQTVSYFQSPKYPHKSSGSLACDFDISIEANTCVVRVDFESVDLAGKLGGICDIDQLFILNSIDGPTTGQCGSLSGYSTIVAVEPSQVSPLKLALLIQNELPYHWFIKITQLPCEALNSFKAPTFCGRVFDDPYEVEDSRYVMDSQNVVWWDYPEPAINKYYYATTKKHMQLAFQGNSDSNNNRRIINGRNTRLGEFPWVVAIGLDAIFFCGGAVISNLFVLTAAHCFLTRDSPVDSLVVHIGDYDLLSENETQHVIRGVKRVLFHSHFHPFLLANDIALLQLDKPVSFNIFIQPICLPSPEKYLAWKDATVVGWGFTSFPMGEPSPRLQKLQVRTISNTQCAKLIEEPVSPGMICATSRQLQGTCFGDSGGPLSLTSKEGVNTIIGVVSFGISGCATLPGVPDLYTKVSEYIPWIHINAVIL